MATDLIQLYNLALDTVGARNKISLPSEDSREAEACNLWFPTVRDQVLASAAWPEATKMERLALLSTNLDDADGVWVQGQPRPDFNNAYGVPSDMLRPQYLYGFYKFALQSYGAEDRAIMTNQDSPILVYTHRQEVIKNWSPELKMAIMYGLAANIVLSLTGKASRAKTLIEQANNIILAARETAANSNDDNRLESVPDWISARGFTDGSSQQRFFYPFGSTLAIGSVN